MSNKNITLCRTAAILSTLYISVGGKSGVLVSCDCVLGLSDTLTTWLLNSACRQIHTNAVLNTKFTLINWFQWHTA